MEEDKFKLDVEYKLPPDNCDTDIKGFMKQIASKYTKEFFEKASKNMYADDRACPENFSNWYNHIVDFGKFRHAGVIANQVFTWQETQAMRKSDVIEYVDFGVINKILEPTLNKLDGSKLYSIKNGTYSNKFDFITSIVTKRNLAENLWKINYNSTLFDTGGYTELVVREFIPLDPRKVPTIYNGMPLREELRVFYNMDTKHIEYIVDYWDYNYCEPNIKNRADNIIFNWFHNKYGNRQIKHKDILHIVEKQIRDYINTLKFDECLTGIWSIDFMYVDDLDDYKGIWLVDMARGFRSAYWEPNKCKGV